MQSCDNDCCDTDLCAGDEIIEYAGHHYCIKNQSREVI